MNVLIIGGYGVFGSRLAELLLRDSHQVTIAGRNAKAAASLSDRLNCSWMVLDREGDLDKIAPFDVIIDAAGPFHSYKDNPYRVAEKALQFDCHYLDLSDDATFCAGISRLNARANSAKKCVCSGMSSVPAISSAAVAHLLGSDKKPDLIEAAILPGNKSARGRSVMHSILAQAGTLRPIFRAGQWREFKSWSEPKIYSLLNGERRQAWMIEVPDQNLFPSHFQAKSVVFRAGLELGIIRYGLAFVASLKQKMKFEIGPSLLPIFHFFATLLKPFGTGIGGMHVAVHVGQEKRVWRLLVKDNQGPFIPAIAMRALLRRQTLPVGASSALAVVALDEIEDAMSDLSASTSVEKTPYRTVFQRVLGERFEQLPRVIQRTHLTSDQSYWAGRGSVVHGTGIWGAILRKLFRFPSATDDIEVKVMKRVMQNGQEVWTRQFGDTRFRSFLKDTQTGLTERFGPFTFQIELQVKDRELHYPITSGRLGFLPIPQGYLPKSITREYVEDGKFHFDVRIIAPFAKDTLVHYRGWLKEN